MKTIAARSQYVFKVSFMKTLSLSVSKPKSAKGSCLRSSVSTALNRFCFPTRSGAPSVHPVTTSVRTSVWTKLPRAH